MGICNILGRSPTLFALTALLATPACDPAQDAPASEQDGPTFLTVIRAAVQPTSPDEGVAMVVQARGGYVVGINTYGGQHRYAAVGTPTTSSCAELPGSEPLYVLVKPDDRACVLEARLYADCDPDDGGSAQQMCTSNNGGFLTSVVVPVAGAVINQREAGAASNTDAAALQDAAADADGDADRPAEGGALRDINSDTAADAFRGDR